MRPLRSCAGSLAAGLAWLALAVVFLFPFYWLVNSSLKGPEAIAEDPPRFLPDEQQTAPLPDAALSVVAMADGVEALRLGDLEGGGQVVVRLFRQGELTRDVRVADRTTLKPLGRTAALPEKTAPLAGTPDGQKALVVGAAEVEGQTIVYWIPQGGAWAVHASPSSVLRPVRRLAPRWSNYAEALAQLPFDLFFRNSFLLCLVVTLGQLISSSLAAYAFARLRFPGRDALFMVLLATLMIPAEVTLIPMFLGFKTLGWVDSYLPLVVPQFCAGAFNVFLLRQFFMTLPIELDEAASLDGAGHFTILCRVILPLSKPALIVVAVFTFVGCWKDLMGPLIYLDSLDKRTVALGLEYLRNPHQNNGHLIMAAATVSMIPVALLFFAAQRHILKGIALTGINR